MQENEKLESVYSLRKRIKELEERLSRADADLCMYKNTCINIFNGIIEVAERNQTISQIWILKQFKNVFR